MPGCDCFAQSDTQYEQGCRDGNIYNLYDSSATKYEKAPRESLIISRLNRVSNAID